MALRKSAFFIVCAATAAGCSFGPRLHSALPQVRDVPVLANLSPDASLTRARAYLAARQFGLAIELFKSASRDPDLKPESLNGLAIAYDGIGRRDLAERYFEEALAARPGDMRTRRNLARLYERIGRSSKRQRLMAEVEEAAPANRPQAADPDDGRGPASTAAPRAASFEIVDTESPLGGTLGPLLVQAGLPSSGPMPAASVAEAASVLCLDSDSGAKAAPSTREPVRMFRLSIGEVYISRQPFNTICRIADPAAAAQPMSNTEYLGLVAAYLDELNRNPRAVQIAALWRSAFRVD
ncbi:tetratricopeptide repeat protein [Sphingopyxis indica]|uniref:Uncharacterized protein n=1 Tax=Sphingopyxis indica TaxID=436663 RepID=A0A239K5I2_9SPHN|nr:tetratricopeptide repeat protein [Sphingopyxis indica]SNT12903.1 hypothetical protein SAMN06295955_11287 [Sphingopyxis indica]